jgi:hypothetical protein
LHSARPLDEANNIVIVLCSLNQDGTRASTPIMPAGLVSSARFASSSRNRGAAAVVSVVMSSGVTRDMNNF